MSDFRWPDEPKTLQAKISYVIINLIFVVLGFSLAYLTLPLQSQDWYYSDILTFLAVGAFSTAFVCFLFWYVLLSVLRGSSKK